VAQTDGGDMERESKRGRGRVAVIAKPKNKSEVDRKEAVAFEPMWRVILHNDDVHTFDYVTMSIANVVKSIKRKKAFNIAVQAHSSGQATVTCTFKQAAKTFCIGLQHHGLTVSIAPDASNSDGKGDGSGDGNGDGNGNDDGPSTE